MNPTVTRPRKTEFAYMSFTIILMKKRSMMATTLWKYMAFNDEAKAPRGKRKNEGMRRIKKKYMSNEFFIDV